MERTSSPWQSQQKGEGIQPKLMLVVAAVLIAGATLAVLYPPIEGTNTGIPVSRKVSQLVYPAAVVQEIAQPNGGEWLLPAGLARIDDTTFVLDTGNDRILRLDAEGHLLATLDSTSLGVALDQPMAVATGGARLFVANSLASEVLVIGQDGALQQSIRLEPMPGDRAPRPIGIAARRDGAILVSDAENHRVLFLDPGGRLIKAVGTGLRAGEAIGFNVPGAITLDQDGNAYVVDTLNGRVVKLAPDGAYLAEYGRLADTAGSLARPKGVAVDENGRVFVSDGLQAAIEVFAADGGYLGVIGRRDPDDAAAGSVFEAPAALWLSGDRLTVIDGIAGLVTLELSEPAARPVNVPE